MNRRFLAAGILFIAIGIAMLAGKLLTFDAIVAFIGRSLSRDQVVTGEGEALISRSWYAAATVALLLGGLLSVCSVSRVRAALAQWIGRDALAAAHPETPHPSTVLLWSSLIGMVVVGLYLMHSHLGIRMHLLFKKEGLLENLTFVLYLLSAVACARAALQARRNPTIDHHYLVAAFYLVCALAFFMVAGEEVSWGQRVFGIQTPEALSAVNHQQEINVHNLLTKPALDMATKGVAVMFLLGLIGIWVLVVTIRLPALQYVVPHPSLAGLALLTGYSGLVLHLEIFEVLLSIFIAFYSYRLYRVAASRLGSYAPGGLIHSE